MKKNTKLALGIIGLLGTTVLLSSCTNSFVTVEEKAKILFNLEQGVTNYCDSATAAIINDSCQFEAKKVYEGNNNLYYYVPTNEDGTYVMSKSLNSIISECKNNGVYAPTLEYLIKLDQKVLDYSLDCYNQNNPDNKLSKETLTVEDVGYVEFNNKQYNKVILGKLLDEYGFNKFYSNNKDSLWGNYELWSSEIELEIGSEKCPSIDFVNLYKKTLEGSLANYRSVITTVDNKYGNYGQFNKPISITSKSWGEAWSHGLIEGLIVYPVAWMLDSFTNLFGGGTSSSAVPQLLALTLVTLIVRGILFLVSWRSTMQQGKMQEIQPQLAKLQQKYPNSNTNQSQKQRLAQEQMELYQKNGIKPFAALVVLVVQFPLFIGVWGAISGSAVLSTGSVLGLNLGAPISETLTNFSNWPKTGAWWTALVLFILMGVSQFISMKLPQWIQKKRQSKVSRLGKNPAEDQQTKTMKIVSWVMLIMIIIMGFSLPSAMGYYWFLGAIISVIQTVITTTLTNKKSKVRR